MELKMDVKQRGISLLEVMLSLAIIAIILVMATRYFGIASRSSNLNAATSQVNEIRQGVAQFHNNLGTWPATLQDLKNQGYITDQTASGTTPWAGTTINLTAAPGGAPNIVIDGNWGTANCQNMANRFGSANLCNGSTFSIPAVIQQ